MIILLV